jgi:hypothetical protein
MMQELPPAGKRDHAKPSLQRTDLVTPQREFFIPDLCAARPTVFSILLAELMVLVHFAKQPARWLGRVRPEFTVRVVGGTAE